jgi:ABC-type Co2+ transport system permease subunit
MKTQKAYNKWTNALLILMAAISMTACGKKDSNNAASAVIPVGPGIGVNCTSCAGFTQGPVLYQGTAVDPGRNAFAMPSVQVVGDAAGYQQVANSGVRPLVNGSYTAGVSGVFHLAVPIACGSVTYPVGDYTIQSPQQNGALVPYAMGQQTNGVFYAPTAVLTGPVAIQPAAVMMVVVDANLDNVADRGVQVSANTIQGGSMLRVGFCGVWFDMTAM